MPYKFIDVTFWQNAHNSLSRLHFSSKNLSNQKSIKAKRRILFTTSLFNAEKKTVLRTQSVMPGECLCEFACEMRYVFIFIATGKARVSGVGKMFFAVEKNVDISFLPHKLVCDIISWCRCATHWSKCMPYLMRVQNYFLVSNFDIGGLIICTTTTTKTKPKSVWHLYGDAYAFLWSVTIGLIHNSYEREKKPAPS